MKSNQPAAANTPLTDDTWNMRDMISKFGLTQTEILEAVKVVGPSKAKVEEYLASRQ
jgi:hypothetical protein